MQIDNRVSVIVLARTHGFTISIAPSSCVHLRPHGRLSSPLRSTAQPIFGSSEVRLPMAPVLKPGLHSRNGGLARPLLSGSSSLLSALVAEYTTLSVLTRVDLVESLQRGSLVCVVVCSSMHAAVGVFRPRWKTIVSHIKRPCTH